MKFGVSWVLKGFRPILVKVVLFQLIGQWRPLDDGATPSFFINSESSVLGLSNDISFVAFLLWEGGQNSKIVKSTLLPSRLF